MNTNIEAKNDRQSLAEEKRMGRRDFINATGLATAVLDVGIGASRSFAQVAAQPAKASAKDFHDEIITIDGTSPLMGENHQEKFVDWYKTGPGDGVRANHERRPDEFSSEPHRQAQYVPVPPLIPETEKRRYREAGERRTPRLSERSRGSVGQTAERQLSRQEKNDG